MFNPQSEWAIPEFAFPAVAGTHLSTPEGRKVELHGLDGWLRSEIPVVYVPEGSHPTTNRAQCRTTALIETNALPLH